MKKQERNFTEGRILVPLLSFGFPILLALVLQSLYGAVDLLIVGQFGQAADISGVSTGAQIMMTLNGLIAGFAMSTTVILGQQIGERKGKEAGHTIGAGIVFFLIVAVIMTVLVLVFSVQIARIMQAPAEAFGQTVSYIRICGGGLLVIIAYNLIGSIFRGIGDSQTPLIAVAIACVVNILGDLLLVAVLHMGAAGAAIATVAAQAISVVLSFFFIRRKKLPFQFSRRDIAYDGRITRRMLRLGTPIALQDLLVGISFLVIMAIVNSLGLTASAGVGVAEKVCGFIMLVPSAFMQAMTAFTAQNVGARRYDRAEKALRYVILVSVGFGFVMFYISFFHGTLLTGVFSHEESVVLAGADYLKAYAIDCLLTAFLFCFIGYYNGLGLTQFVMLQGIIGAFGVRIPVSFLMSRMTPVSLFHIGLATPASSLVQILLCFGCMVYVRKKIMNHIE